jgi:hypothetical protein
VIKSPLTLTLVTLFALHHLQTLHAQDVSVLARQISEVQAADDARIATMRSPKRDELDTIFSNDLHYAHSNGVIDTKASFVEKLVSGKSKYTGYDHRERAITIPAPGIALINGQARIQTESANGKMDSTLSYLAVWRQEAGQWRFLAWQSCKLPVANP